MNRRQKIIVSITGIFLVLLTRINGNDNEKVLVLQLLT